MHGHLGLPRQHGVHSMQMYGQCHYEGEGERDVYVRSFHCCHHYRVNMSARGTRLELPVRHDALHAFDPASFVMQAGPRNRLPSTRQAPKDTSISPCA